MKFIFNRGFMCCGCGARVTKEDTCFIYKKSCLCIMCSKQLDRVANCGLFDVGNGISFLISPFYYMDFYRNIFLEFKFCGNTAFGHILGMAAAQCCAELTGLQEYDFITPVPLSVQRMRQRGFNQSEIMCRYMAQSIGIPMRNVLTRPKHCVAQSTLTGLQRIKNVQGAFAIKEDLTGNRIILFDDIYTTGSTAAECTKVLKNAGAEEVCVISAAVVYRKPKTGIYRL